MRISSTRSSRQRWLAPAATASPVPRTEAQHAVVQQLAVGPGDRIGVDRQLAGQFPDGRDQLAFLEHLAGDGELDLPDDLVVDGQFVVEIDLEEHGLSSVLVT